MLGRPAGRLVDEDPVGGRAPTGAATAVLRTSPAAIPSPSLRACVEVDERLPGGGPDPDGETERRVFAVQLRDRLADRERGADGALRVVLVRDRSAEDGHHRVADELLDGAAEALELGLRRARGTAQDARGRPRGRDAPRVP